jgi:hypothetical protein
MVRHRPCESLAFVHISFPLVFFFVFFVFVLLGFYHCNVNAFMFCLKGCCFFISLLS